MSGDEGWGFADIYAMDEERGVRQGEDGLPPVREDAWRNILVWGRATPEGVHPEALAMVGRARHLADEMGCRVEVLLIGEDLEAATRVLSRYPIDTVYRVRGPDYAPIDHSARILEAVVRKRRPELVLVFQSRTGDAVAACTASRLGASFAIGALAVEMDPVQRRAVVTHQSTNASFRVVTRMLEPPQFVSVQRGLFRAPLTDPDAHVKAFDLDIDPGPIAGIKVLERRPPQQADIDSAERVVVAGLRVHDPETLERCRELARRLGARFGVARSLVDRGLAAEDDAVVGRLDTSVRPRLLVTVGVHGSLDFLEAIQGNPTVAALASRPDDPVARIADYVVQGEPGDVVAAVLEGL